MRIWLVTIGEPIQVDYSSARLLRTGMLAQHLAALGHQVVWWNSDFDHSAKRHHFGRNTTIACNLGLEQRLLHGCGYRSHISIARIRDHRQVAVEFLSEAASLPPPNAIVAAFPTIELADSCRRYASRHGIPFALDLRDLWPDIFAEAVPRMLRPVARLMLRPYDQIACKAMSAADALIGITEPILEWGLAKARRPRRDLDAVIPFAYKSPTASAADLEFPRSLGLDPQRQLIICFFGTFGRQFDLATVIKAMQRMSPEESAEIRFVLCGAGDRHQEYRDQASSHSSILFPGWIDAAQIRSVMSVSHMGLAPYFPRHDFSASIPNKPIEYMSAGLPILTCLDGLLADTVCRERIGITYGAGSADSLVSAIRQARSDRAGLAAMGMRAQAIYEKNYRSDIVMEHYHQFIIRLADSRQDSATASQI